MLGCEPDAIEVTRLLADGGPADLDGGGDLCRYGIRAIGRRGRPLRPRVLVAVRTHGPIMAAVRQMVLQSGAREVYLVEHGMATALGLSGCSTDPDELASGEFAGPTAVPVVRTGAASSSSASIIVAMRWSVASM